MPEFRPRLDILPLPQQRLWRALGDVPAEFVLYGGTAAFEDGNVQSLPESVKRRLVAASRAVDLDCLPVIAAPFGMPWPGHRSFR